MLQEFPALQRAVRQLLDGVVDFPPLVAAGFLGLIALLVLAYYVRRGKDLGPLGAPVRKVASVERRAHS